MSDELEQLRITLGQVLAKLEAAYQEVGHWKHEAQMHEDALTAKLINKWAAEDALLKSQHPIGEPPICPTCHIYMKAVTSRTPEGAWLCEACEQTKDKS